MTPSLESVVHGVGVRPHSANIVRLGGICMDSRRGSFTVRKRVARQDPVTPPETKGRAVDAADRYLVGR
eukprot:7852141-Pyramimonas_sp.AAC.1